MDHNDVFAAEAHAHHAVDNAPADLSAEALAELKTMAAARTADVDAWVAAERNAYSLGI